MRSPVRPGILRFRKYLGVNQGGIPQVVTNYLLPYEDTVITVHRHPGLFIGHLSLLAGCCAGAGLLTANQRSAPAAAGAAWGACFVIFLWLIMRADAWRNTYVVATEIRLIIITGLVRRKATTIPLREIEDVTLYRSPLGLAAGYATIVADPVRRGYAIPKLKYMPYPEQLLVEISSLLRPELAES